MSTAKLRAAIVVVSDTAAKDPSRDKSVSILIDTFGSDGGDKWAEPLSTIIRDDTLEIQRSVQSWTDTEQGINLVVTTGGTGFAVKDYTPEAINPLLHRHAPGLVHAMLSASFQVTPFAAMSRPIAGVRNKTLIITLPGSPKAAKENLQAVLKLLPHACMQAAGEDSRTAHAGGVRKLEKDAGISSMAASDSVPSEHVHSHHHHHVDFHTHSHGHKIPRAHTDPSDLPPQSNDPSRGATFRARSSPYPMLAVLDAVSLILRTCLAPMESTQPITSSLVGCVISSDIRAAEAVPAYRASIVDGYAVIVPSDDDKKTTKGIYPVAHVSLAQSSSMPPPLSPGSIARITTGAPLPENANAVIMVEDTVVASTTTDESEEATVEILTDDLEIGENVREPGSDIKLNSLILSKGTRMTSVGGEIGMLAAAGIAEVPIYSRPRIGVLSTGDEVTDVSFPGELHGGQIRDSNRPSLISALTGWNLCSAVVDLGIARDTPPGELDRALRDGFRIHDLDIIITTGGVSMGELDLLKPTVERSLGGTVHFGRVNMKPGKPTTFASVPFKESSNGAKTEKLIFGLPGNPASALVTAHLFVLPALQKMAGVSEAKGMERVVVKVKQKVKCDEERVEYHRVVVSVDQGTGILEARSTGMQRSSRVGSLASANALLELPQREGWVEEGALCPALMMGPVVGY